MLAASRHLNAEKEAEQATKKADQLAQELDRLQAALDEAKAENQKNRELTEEATSRMIGPGYYLKQELFN